MDIISPDQDQQVKNFGQVTPPLWLKIIIRAWACICLLFLASGTLFGIFKIFATVSLSEIYQVDGPIVAAVFVAVMLLAIGILSVEAAFLIGLYRFRKWALPILYAHSGVVFLSVFTAPLAYINFPTLLGVLLGSGLWFVLGLLGFWYRNSFSGSYQKLLIQTPTFILLLPMFLVSVASLLFRDLPPVDDQDIILSEITLPANEENAYNSLPQLSTYSTDIRMAVEEGRKLREEYLETGVWNQEGTDRVISTTLPITTGFIEASTKDYYQCPLILNKHGFDTALCPLVDIRNIAELTSLRAINEARGGDVERAVETAGSILRFGQLMNDAPQTLIIEYLVSVDVKDKGLETLEYIVPTYSISTSTKEDIVDFLPHYVGHGGIVTAIRAEYMAFKTSMDPFRDIHNFYVQPNRFKHDIARVFRKNIEVAKAPCNELGQLSADLDILVWEETEKGRNSIMLPFTRNAVGEVLKAVVLASLGGSKEKGCEVDARIEALRRQLITK